MLAPITRSMVDDVGGESPTLCYVNTDHLHCPVKMSDASKAIQWSAEYQPWGPCNRSPVRCAIYMRKSSEAGLEQEFNSLDAQREACEAYIRSQKSTGWFALPITYDDGGISDGPMDRPDLQRWLTNITAGRFDTVVVYKVDRFTRSLRDFAVIVDTFDAKSVSFVSVASRSKAADPSLLAGLIFDANGERTSPTHAV